MGRFVIRDRIVEFRRVPARELIPHPANWRRHPAAQRKALREMLERVGYADVLLARETAAGLQLIDGHLRAETTPDAEVPVLVLDVDEEEARTLLATLDPLAAMADRDQGALAELLATVTVPTQLLADLLPMPLNAEREVVLEPPTVPVTKRGDLWQLGAHRLLCGDASAEGDQRRLLTEPDQLLVTDPPYGVDYAEKVKRRGGQKQGGWPAIANDDLSGVGLGELLATAFRASRAATALVWFSHEKRHEVEGALRETGFRIAQEIVWAKNQAVFGRADYHWQHEQAALGKRRGHRALVTATRPRSGR